MAKGYILYNPLAGGGQCKEDVQLLAVALPEPVEFFDMTRITNYEVFLRNMGPEDHLIIAGGDGTLNRFVNDTEGLEIPQPILYFPVGTGNDFALDLGKKSLSEPFPVGKYLENLPVVEVKGKRYRFLNAVGYGIDGYCCQVGDALREKTGKKVDYTAIAVKGLLKHYHPTRAVVTVDGKMRAYKKVWLAPVMNGRFYGGGMMAAPEQDRCSEKGTLSLMLFHSAGRLGTLWAFPSIFKGEHVKYKKLVTILTGHEITVEFDRPTPLQIDGETILDVTGYTARSTSCPVLPKK